MGLYLNVGSGQRPFHKPFINVDVQAKWNPDIVASGDSLPMLKDESVEMVVLHHVLEHFGCGEADGLLKECRRVLRPGGSLLVFVPNMAALMDMWQEYRITDQVYMTNVYGAYMGDEADRHKWGYTFATLSRLLTNHGYRPIPFDWREIPGALIAQDRWILGMEGIK